MLIEVPALMPCARRLRRLTLASTLGVAVVLAAQPVTTHAGILIGGAEFQVNTTTAGEQGYPAVTPLSGGGFVLVWESDGQDGSANAVVGRLLDAAGSPAGSEFQLNSHTTLAQDGASVAALPSGGFVAVWESDGQDGVGNGVFGRLFDGSGAPTGAEFQVNTFTNYSQDDASVAADAAGNFVVAWESVNQDGDANGVFVRRFDATAAALTAEIQANTFTLGGQVDPDVATDAVGNFVVVWTSNNQDGSAAGVFGKRFTSAGVPVGTEFQINTFTLSGQDESSVAMASTGEFTVVWESNLQDGSMNGVYGQRFTSGGSPAGTEFRVNTETLLAQDDADVVYDSAGNFTVAWESVEQDGFVTGTAVMARRYDSGGAEIGAEFQVNVYTPDSQDDATVAIAPGGDFVVAWNSFSQDGQYGGIFTRHYAEGICDPIPEVGCKLATTGGAQIQIKDKGGAKDQLKWKHRKADTTTTAEFMDPAGSSAALYRVCVYDSAGGEQPLLEADVPPQGTCGSKPCWKATGTKGFKYKNKTAAPNGITGAKFKQGASGKAQVQIKGKGAALNTPALPLTFPVTVQLVVDDGVTRNCWQSTYTSSTKNDATQVKAKGP